MIVVAAVPGPTLPVLVAAAAAGSDTLVPLDAAQLTSAADPVALVRSLTPDVVLVDVDADLDRISALTPILVAGTGALLVWVTRRADELALPALRAGAKDLIHPESTPEQYGAVLQRLRATGPVLGAPRIREAGRVVSVLSPKGGVGKTTVATNLAVGLAQAMPQEVVLVDLDVQFGDVSSALDLDSDYSVVDTVRGAARTDPMVMKAYLTRHRTGLSVVCAPQAPAEADQITPADAADLLSRLAAEFAFVVVDTAPGLDEHTLAAIDASTDLIMVTSLDVPGIRGLRKELDTLTQLGVSTSRQIVLNMVDRHGGLTPTDASATIGAPIDVTLPRCKTVVAAVNRGVPLLETSTRNAFTKQAERLLHRVAPELTLPRRRGPKLTELAVTEQAVSVVPRRALVRRPGRRNAAIGGAA